MESVQGSPVESKTEKAAIALTPTEKQALRFVAIHRKTTESELLRVMLMVDIVAEYDRLTAVLEQAG